jgi:hypothetical protein
MTVLRMSIAALAFSLTSACTSPPPRAATQPPTDASARLASVPESQADVDALMRRRGYKPAMSNGQRVYCRNEALTGSNLEAKVCLTEKQIEDQQRAAQDIFNGPRPVGCAPNFSCDRQ